MQKLRLQLYQKLLKTGIAGGQELDLSFEKKKMNLEQIINMQKKKTGKLFNFCCFSAGLVDQNIKEKKLLSLLGEDIGLLFQLADDFLILVTK